jgi:hypothetical protein
MDAINDDICFAGQCFAPVGDTQRIAPQRAAD